jgi:hypothetical protein
VTRPLTKLAHDPGDSQITSHCPFCGSGQVIGRSDGNIECEFCGMTYLVRIQPMFTGMPQQPMGGGFGGPSSMATDLMAPGMIGPDGMPLPPEMADPELAAEEESAGVPFGAPPGEEVDPETGEPMEVDPETGEPIEMGPPGTEGGDGGGFPPGDGEEMPPGEEGEEDGDAPPWADEKEDSGPPSKGEKKDSGKKKNADKDKKKPPIKKKSAAARFPNKRVDTPEYRKHYNRGWRTSERAAYWSGEGNSPLERGDLRGEPGSWYDGYMDHAVDRPKWHSLTCPSDEHEQPGCSLVDKPGTTAIRRRGGWSATEGDLYQTIAGDWLPRGAYIRHLACLHGGVEAVRLRRTA